MDPKPSHIRVLNSALVPRVTAEARIPKRLSCYDRGANARGIFVTSIDCALCIQC